MYKEFTEIQHLTVDLKRLLGTHKHFWLPAYDGSNHEVCGSCESFRFETYAQAEDYYYENLAKHSEDYKGFDRWLCSMEVLEETESEDVLDWEMQ